MKKMGNTLLISILRGLFYVVYSMRARLWYIRMYCDTLFWAMIFWIFGECSLALKILCLVYGILRLLQVGTCWAKNWSVVMSNPGEMYCWNDQGH